MRKFTSPVIPLLLFSLFAQAEVYTWINEDGVRVYGDEPPASKNIKKVDLPAIQQLPEQKYKPKQTKAKQAKVEEDESTFAGYSSFKMVAPKMNETITTGQAGNVSVQFAVSPDLQPGHEVTLFLNNKPIQSAAALSFSLDNLDRGSHLLHAHIKYQGKLMIATGKRRIHVQRPSILNRSRAQ